MTIDDSSTIQKVRGCTLCFSLFIMACGCNSEVQESNTEPYVTAPTTYSVSFSAMDGGSIDNAGGNFETGAMLTINAIADDGFIFTQWSDGNSENPREILVNSNLTLTAEFLPSFNLNLRVHLMQGEPWLHSSGISMETWVTADNVREHILPELNSIWQIAGVVWELESIINEPMVTYDGYEEDVKYIVDSTRDGSGRSDPNRLPH